MAQRRTEIELKGGHITTDPRLDRLPQFDERNLRYLAAPDLLQAGKKPRGYTWRVPVHLDQGREGACVGFAFAHEAAARPVITHNISNEYARTRIYHRAQQIDPWPGGSYPGASPFYEGTSTLAGAKAAVELGHFGLYEWAYTVPDLSLAVGYKGPAVIGVNWYSGMFATNSDGFIGVSGYVAGGHAILVYGVSVKYGYFKLWNSWGADWGVGGTAKITFDDMARLLSEDGEACLPQQRRRVNID